MGGGDEDDVSVDPLLELLDESSFELPPESPPDELDESDKSVGGLLRSPGDGENDVPVFTPDVPPEVDEESAVEPPPLLESLPDVLGGLVRSVGSDGE